MPKKPANSSVAEFSTFYWTRFPLYEEITITGYEAIKGEGEIRQYSLTDDIAPKMLRAFLDIKDSKSAIEFLDEYGFPCHTNGLDIKLGDIIGLANSLRAVSQLIECFHDESYSFENSISTEGLPPWEECKAEFYSLSYSHKLKEQLRKNYPGTNYWLAFCKCYAAAKEKKEEERTDLEKWVFEFYRKREKPGKWLRPSVHSDFYKKLTRKYVMRLGLIQTVPDDTFELPAILTQDWNKDKERYSRYALGNAIKKRFDVLLSCINPTLIWKYSPEIKDFALAEAFKLDSPWNLMCIELQRKFLGKSKYSYCPVCKEPFIRSTKAKFCSNACKQKNHRNKD